MKVKIEDFNYRENTYSSNGKIYRATDIIELAKDLEEFDLPLCGIDIGLYPWGDPSIKSFIYHVKRSNDSDLSYPIILDDTGYICDGWHRVVKAILEGREYIKAKRLNVMPDPEEIKD